MKFSEYNSEITYIAVNTSEQDIVFMINGGEIKMKFLLVCFNFIKFNYCLFHAYQILF